MPIKTRILRALFNKYAERVFSCAKITHLLLVITGLLKPSDNTSLQDCVAIINANGHFQPSITCLMISQSRFLANQSVTAH